MKKGKMVKILEANAKFIKEITMGENDLIRMFEIYSGITLKHKEFTDVFVKVQLDNEQGKDWLINGATLDSTKVKYTYLLTSPGLMKHEDNQELQYKSEAIFIKEEFKGFRDELERIVGLGVLHSLKGKEIAINKDIVSRIGLILGTSVSMEMNPKFKIAILGEMKYIFRDYYKQFNSKIVNEKEYIDLEDRKLVKKELEEVWHTFADGCGYASDEFMDDLQEKLEMDYKLDLVVFRQLGTASKGTISRFNHKHFIKHILKMDSFNVPDYTGKMINLMDYDVILNTTLVKYAKFHSNIEADKRLFTALEINKKYTQLINNITITKTNKSNENLKEQTLSNYQLISNLALAPTVLQEISKETEDIYKRVIDGDIHATRIMLGDIAREDMETLSPSTKAHQLLQIDDEMIKTGTIRKTVESMVNKKVHQLSSGKMYLKGNFKFMISDPVTYFSALTVSKFNNDEIIVGEHYKVPIRLQAKTNYIAGETGTRAMVRFPLNSATEILKRDLYRSKGYDYYLGNNSKEICYYPMDNSMMLASGGDADGDAVFAINDERIYNSIIEDIEKDSKGKVRNWYFRNQFDGGTKKEVYNDENLFNGIINLGGNAIGEIANWGAKVSNKMQELPYRNIKTGRVRTYTYYRDTCLKAGKTKEQFKEIWNKNKANFLDHTYLTDAEISNSITRNFKKYQLDSYYLLYLQQVSIDQVKTGIAIKDNGGILLIPIKHVRDGFKPIYLYHAKENVHRDKRNAVYKEFEEELDKLFKSAKYLKNVNEGAYKTTMGLIQGIYKKIEVKLRYNNFNNTILNCHCNRIQRELGYKARKSFVKDSKHIYTMMKKNSGDPIKELVAAIKDAEDKYHYLRKITNGRIDDITTLRDVLEDQSIELSNDSEIINSLKDRIDVYIDKLMTDVKRNYSYKQILRAGAEVITKDEYEDSKTGELKEKTYRLATRFILMFMYDELIEHLLSIKLGFGTIYEECDKSIADIYYMFKHWKMKTIVLNENAELGKNEIIRKKIKLGVATKVRIRTNGEIQAKEIEIKEKNVIINKVKYELFPEYVGIVDDGIYELDEMSQPKTLKSATLLIA